MGKNSDALVAFAAGLLGGYTQGSEKRYQREREKKQDERADARERREQEAHELTMKYNQGLIDDREYEREIRKLSDEMYPPAERARDQKDLAKAGLTAAQIDALTKQKQYEVLPEQLRRDAILFDLNVQRAKADIASSNASASYTTALKGLLGQAQTKEQRRKRDHDLAIALTSFASTVSKDNPDKANQAMRLVASYDTSDDGFAPEQLQQANALLGGTGLYNERGEVYSAIDQLQGNKPIEINPMVAAAIREATKGEKGESRDDEKYNYAQIASAYERINDLIKEAELSPTQDEAHKTTIQNLKAKRAQLGSLLDEGNPHLRGINKEWDEAALADAAATTNQPDRPMGLELLEYIKGGGSLRGWGGSAEEAKEAVADALAQAKAQGIDLSKSDNWYTPRLDYQAISWASGQGGTDQTDALNFTLGGMLLAPSAQKGFEWTRGKVTDPSRQRGKWSEYFDPRSPTRTPTPTKSPNLLEYKPTPWGGKTTGKPIPQGPTIHAPGPIQRQLPGASPRGQLPAPTPQLALPSPGGVRGGGLPGQVLPSGPTVNMGASPSAQEYSSLRNLPEELRNILLDPKRAAMDDLMVELSRTPLSPDMQSLIKYFGQ